MLFFYHNFVTDTIFTMLEHRTHLSSRAFFCPLFAAAPARSGLVGEKKRLILY